MFQLIIDAQNVICFSITGTLVAEQLSVQLMYSCPTCIGLLYNGNALSK